MIHSDSGRLFKKTVRKIESSENGIDTIVIKKDDFDSWYEYRWSEGSEYINVILMPNNIESFLVCVDEPYLYQNYKDAVEKLNG